jgi:hypothetical protein
MVRYKTVHITKRFVLQNGMRYKTVCVTKRNVTKQYLLQNGMLQNGHHHRTVRYKTVLCIEQVNRSSNNLLEIFFTGKR